MRVAEPNLEQQHDELGDTPLSADPLPHGARVHAEFLGAPSPSSGRHTYVNAVWGQMISRVSQDSHLMSE
jgi:hypothetical protein